jgi:hypothetical protein
MRVLCEVATFQYSRRPGLNLVFELRSRRPLFGIRNHGVVLQRHSHAHT